MQNPNDPFASEGQHPDTHHGDFWRLDGEPHFNSTVLSHWFYLLSVGGDGWNNGHTSHAIPGDGFHWNIQGIGINDAEMIAYLTERLLNSTADYAMARTMSIQAAIQMFGSCSNEVVQVTNAWFAVGVGAAWSSPSFQLYPTYGQDCSSVTVTANFPSSSNVIWTTTNGLLINGNNSPLTIQSNTVVISSPNGMEGYISASMGGCSASMVFCPCQPWDNPSITWVWSSPKRGEPLQAYVSPECPNAFRYLWYINGQLIETTYETFLSTYNWPCVDGELTVIALAACGSTAPVYGGNYSPICSQYGMTSNVKMYPNPASSKVTVKLEDIEISQRQIGDSLTSIKLSSISQIRIIDKMGVVKKIITSAKGSKASSFDVSDLPSDIYYLDITDRVNQVRLPLMIIR